MTGIPTILIRDLASHSATVSALCLSVVLTDQAIRSKSETVTILSRRLSRLALVAPRTVRRLSAVPGWSRRPHTSTWDRTDTAPWNWDLGATPLPPRRGHSRGTWLALLVLESWRGRDGNGRWWGHPATAVARSLGVHWRSARRWVGHLRALGHTDDRGELRRPRLDPAAEAGLPTGARPRRRTRPPTPLPGAPVDRPEPPPRDTWPPWLRDFAERYGVIA